MKKGSIKIKTKKYLTLTVHDIMEPLPDFAACPAQRPSVPRICELDQLLNGILQILKKNAFCRIIELNRQILIPEDFHTAPNWNERFLRLGSLF